ncbi:16680_t:CDS:2 [Funneliformis geosporum]|uniref:16680_t:CDS:1 n=1 Tax=Funneliformis geosporum TaxID=1117311 RepID=A0A9W4SAJ0_9GLOM|nr:16680_t:CDS:2 [Funneliformis geosporum]
MDLNGCIRIVAQTLTDDDSTENYEWILRCTLAASDEEPKTIITDTLLLKCQNSLLEEIFLQCWHNLIKDYPEIVDYLTNTLYENRNYWAKAFVVEIFTANLDSIFQIEVIKSFILANLQSPIFDLIDHNLSILNKFMFRK